MLVELYGHRAHATLKQTSTLMIKQQKHFKFQHRFLCVPPFISLKHNALLKAWFHSRDKSPWAVCEAQANSTIDHSVPPRNPPLWPTNWLHLGQSESLPRGRQWRHPRWASLQPLQQRKCSSHPPPLPSSHSSPGERRESFVCLG